MLDQVEVNSFLINLRDSGRINMLGATPHIQEAFGCTKAQAQECLTIWIKSFEKKET